MESCRARSAAAIESAFTAGGETTSPPDSFVIEIRFVELVLPVFVPDFFAVLVCFVVLGCCACAVGTAATPRAIANAIAQLFESFIRMVSSLSAALRVHPRGRSWRVKHWNQSAVSRAACGPRPTPCGIAVAFPTTDTSCGRRRCSEYSGDPIALRRPPILAAHVGEALPVPTRPTHIHEFSCDSA